MHHQLKPKVPLQKVKLEELQERHHHRVLQKCKDLKNKYQNLHNIKTTKSGSPRRIKMKEQYDGRPRFLDSTQLMMFAKNQRESIGVNSDSSGFTLPLKFDSIIPRELNERDSAQTR
jgi:hypothetical protein